MSYLTQSRMAQDYGLIMRIAACAASEGITVRPESWADDRRIGIIATPGWAAAYADSSAADPGSDEEAITDQMIRDAVLAALTASPPPSEPDPESPAE